jgi:nucleoside-diphosphate-sugar epimerase
MAEKPVMKHIVLTGGTGFVGANLARRLLRDGHVVHLLVRASHAEWRIQEIRDRIQLHVVDFMDATAVSKQIEAIGPEWIFHLAAHGAYSWQNDLNEIVQTNFLSTINLVNACLQTGFEAFIHTGTSSEYGFKDHPPSETEWLEPNSAYAVAKASATLFCRYTAQSRTANIITLRLYSAYGPYEEPKRLMPNLIAHGLRGELPPLVNPDIARDYVYVDDICDACILAAQKPPGEPGAVYNVGTSVQTSLREVVETARRVMRITAEPQWGSMPSRIWDTAVWVADSSKIREELGWRPQFDFESGLRRMVEWCSSRAPARTEESP